jgi:hypothetical protein
MARTFGWLEVDLIAELLAESHPNTDPRGISFAALRTLVRQLPDFAEEPGHPCNEKILETIQANWIEERDGRTSDES